MTNPFGALQPAAKTPEAEAKRLAEERLQKKAKEQALTYIPNAKLLQSGSGEVGNEIELAEAENRATRFSAGHFFSDGESLGKELLVVPVATEMLALEYTPTFKFKRKAYGVLDKTFDEIDASEGGQVGPEVVFWLPEKGRFVAIHFTKTAASCGYFLREEIGKGTVCRLYSKKSKSASGYQRCIGEVSDVSIEDLVKDGKVPSEELLNKAIEVYQQTIKKANEKNDSVSDTSDAAKEKKSKRKR